MKKLLFISFPLFVLIQLSCTSELFINTTLPADVAISNDQWKVVVLNRYNAELTNFEDDETEKIYREGSMEAFYGALDAILADSTYALIHYDSVNYKKKTPQDSLTSDQLKIIHQKHPFHLLLSLDHFDVKMEEERVVGEGIDGSESSVANYYLVVQSDWILSNENGAKPDETSLMQEELYKSRPVLYDILAISPSFRKAAPSINRLAWFTGNDYWKRLSPQSVSFVRPYYSGGKLKEAAAAMAAEEWDLAIVILEPMAGRNDNNSAKAAYNLAVIYENLGMIEEAKHWGAVAALKKDKFAVFLLTELEKYNYKSGSN